MSSTLSRDREVYIERETERQRERERGRGRAELGERETYGGRRQIEGYTFIMDNRELAKKRES